MIQAFRPHALAPAPRHPPARVVAVLAASFLLFFAPLNRPVVAATTPAAWAPVQADPADASAPPPPWGHLETFRIMIEPPDDFVTSESLNAPSAGWVFKGYSQSSLDGLWQRAGLNETEIQALNDPQQRTTTRTAIVIRPSPEVILNLKPEARATIYSALAEFPENIAQHDPFRFRADSIDEWFEDNDLPADIIALTKSLLYRRGVSALFSDYALVLPRLASPAARHLFLKTIARKSALLVQLKIHRHADIDALVDYWGRGRRSKDLRPFLHSLSRRPGGSSVDIVHLLPPFARALLYTYPNPSDRAADAARDCHWTSLNFFNAIPDDRFKNIDFVRQTLLDTYTRVDGAPELGDVVVLLQPGGVVIHSCVYLADNIVFTKNGGAFSVPWTLSRLDNVVVFYSVPSPVEVRFYRARNP